MLMKRIKTLVAGVALASAAVLGLSMNAVAATPSASPPGSSGGLGSWHPKASAGSGITHRFYYNWCTGNGCQSVIDWHGIQIPIGGSDPWNRPPAQPWPGYPTPGGSSGGSGRGSTGGGCYPGVDGHPCSLMF